MNKSLTHGIACVLVCSLPPLALAQSAADGSSTTAASSTAGQGFNQAQPAAPAATKRTVALKSPTDWIVSYDERTYTPVADEVSRHLAAARKAFDAGDDRTAATEMRAVADGLKAQAARANAERLARDVSARLDVTVRKIDAITAALESGKIKTTAELDKAIDAARADLERRWVVTDVEVWYPVSEEPQRHFGAAAAAYAKHDYDATATEIRKAAGYIRLEAGRASGEAKRALDSSVKDLDKLAVSVEKGAAGAEKSMDGSFARAQRALAVEHRAKAAEAWAHRQYEKAGYELKAAAHSLESAAGWADGKAKAAVSTAGADARSLGDKLASGATWAGHEVALAFKKLGNAVGALDR